VLLEHEGISERRGIMDAAGMAKAIVHDDEGIGKDGKLVTGQIATYEDMRTYLAVQ
jgi:hypothetical protein